MFTGIVEEVGTITEATKAGGLLRLRVRAREVLADLGIGDSILVSGCCLTAVERDAEGFEVELAKETVAKTAPRWHSGARVNLERALALDGRFGGHLVSGHVEAAGTVTRVSMEAGDHRLTVRAPARLAPYLLPKGSVTVDGVSLTIVDVGGPAGSRADLGASDFTLSLIPHTLAVTTLGDLEEGALVNLETDLLARYAERFWLVRSGTANVGRSDVVA